MTLLQSELTVKFSELVFTLDHKSKINQALIQRCVDKRLFDGDFLQRSMDMEMMELGRRIFSQPESDSTSGEVGNVLGFGRNDNSKFAPAGSGDEIRQPIEIQAAGEVKE